MTDVGWGQLSPLEGFGRVGDKPEDFEVVSFENVQIQYPHYKQAGHAMIYAHNEAILWNLYKARATILMQMRFDGLLGFPGGLVDPGEDPLTAVNRELEEEIGLDLTKHRITQDNYFSSHVHHRKSLVLHFYVKQVSLDEFKAIELANLSAPEYGNETLGIVRPPLYTMGDGVRGLPAFLSNSYVGNAWSQLVNALSYFKLLSDEELKLAIEASNALIKNKLS